MTRKKTSAERGKSWKDMPVLKLKSGKGLKKFDPDRFFRSREKVSAGLAQSILDGDAEAFLDILSAYMRTQNKARLARRAKVGRQTLYRTLAKKANPRLTTIMAFMQASR